MCQFWHFNLISLWVFIYSLPGVKVTMCLLKVPMKRFFFSHIFEIYRLKYAIPKFKMFRVKMGDFTSLQVVPF